MTRFRAEIQELAAEIREHLTDDNSTGNDPEHAQGLLEDAYALLDRLAPDPQRRQG